MSDAVLPSPGKGMRTTARSTDPVAEAFRLSGVHAFKAEGGAGMNGARGTALSKASRASIRASVNGWNAPGVGGWDEMEIEDRDKPALTFKAVASGVLMGTLNTFILIYYGLKTGVFPALNVVSAPSSCARA